MSFDKAFEKTVGIEGGYSNNPKDTGGETMYGVTKRVAMANGYYGDMRSMPLSTAKQIYKNQYWDINKLDSVSKVSEEIAEEIFDTGVNMGVTVAGKFLQRALNVLNREGKDFRDIAVDGAIGPMTVACLKEFIDHRKDDGVKVIMALLNAQQGVRYIEIAEKREANETFMYGWVLRRL